jgi:hypothetical protein
MDTYYLYALLINGTPFGVDVEELPENIHLETAAAVTHDGKDSAIINSGTKQFLTGTLHQLRREYS